MTSPLEFLPFITEKILADQQPVIVTGAGGWLGMAALEMLESALGDRIHAQVQAFTSVPRHIKLRSGRNISAAAFHTINKMALAPSLIMHFAFITRGHVQNMPLQDYIAANQTITDCMIELIERCGALGIFVPSTGAVYRPDHTLDEDITNNPYGVLKLADEAKFQNLAQRLNFPSALIRIFNLSGPYINNRKSYALASILMEIAQHGPVILQSNRNVWRSYTHIADVLNVAMAILIKQCDIQVFDTAGEASIEIGDLASRAAIICGKPAIAIKRPDITNNNNDIYLGDGKNYHRLAKALQLSLLRLDDQIKETYAYLKTVD